MTYEAAAEHASKAAYVSAGGTAIAGFALNEWAMIVGIAATVLTLCINWYYKQKHLELARKHAGAINDDE